MAEKLNLDDTCGEMLQSSSSPVYCPREYTLSVFDSGCSSYRLCNYIC